MPQLDFTTYLPQMFWMFLIFGGFVALCSFVILPRLGFIVNTRDSFVKEHLKQAEQNSAKIKELEAMIEELNKKSLQDSDKIIEDAKKQAELIIQQGITRADEEYRKLFKEESLKFEELSMQMLKNNQSLVDELAAKVVSKIKE